MRNTVALLLAFICPLFGYSCDNEEIESAYMNLFSKEFGYTLIGEKPASLEETENYHLATHPDVLHLFITSLQKTFSVSKTLILKVFIERPYYIIELIHKKSIENVISKNRSLQHFIHTKFKNKAEFYKKLEDPTIGLVQLFMRDPYLIGLILGYGRANSEYCCRRGHVGRYLKKHPLQSSFTFYKERFMGWRGPENLQIGQLDPIEVLTPNPGFNSLEAEWQWIQEIAWDLDGERKAQPPYFIALPFYVCRHGGDSEMTRARYQRAQAKLAALFYNKHFHQAVYEEVHKQ